MKNITSIIIAATCVAIFFSSCKVCKQCASYVGEDINGNPTYSDSTAEKCKTELEDAESEKITDLISGEEHAAFKCDFTD